MYFRFQFIILSFIYSFQRGNFSTPSKFGGNESQNASKVEFSLPQNAPEPGDGTLQMSDLTSRENQSSATQRGSNSNTARDEIPISTEVNLTDFQASLHMQQLLQRYQIYNVHLMVLPELLSFISLNFLFNIILLYYFKYIFLQ